MSKRKAIDGSVIGARARNGGKGNVGAKSKPDEQKKIPIAFYVPQAVVDELGGKDIARQIAKAAVENKVA